MEKFSESNINIPDDDRGYGEKRVGKGRGSWGGFLDTVVRGTSLKGYIDVKI